MDDAKKKEILGLVERGTFKLVLEEEAGPNPNLIPSRYVLAIKHSSNGSTVYKARLVLGGHGDKEKRSAVHNTYNLKQSSIRLILALVTILGFDVWSLDVKKAYLQAASTLRRNIFVKPESLELKPGETLQVVKPLHGVAESGDYRCETNHRFHVDKLRMKQSTGDFVLFFRRAMKKLISISGSYVDEVWQTGTQEEKKRIQDEFRKVFDVKISNAKKFMYTGIECDNRNKTERKLSQEHYISRLHFLKKNSSFPEFSSLRAQLAWVVHTRPDIAFAVSFAAQFTETMHNTTCNQVLKSILRHLQASVDRELKYPKLDMDSLRILVYVDASHNNLENNRSQLGFVIILADKTDRCSFLRYTSYKSRRVTRSNMAGEALVFVDRLDCALLLRHERMSLLGRKLPILMLKDSEIHFDVLTRSRYTTEKRLMIDISSAREAYREKKIAKGVLIHSDYNYADSPTNIKVNSSMQKLIETNKISPPIRQWVIQPCW